MSSTFTRGRLLAALCLLLCGCRIDADLLIDVNRSGGGVLTLTLLADADAVARAEASGTQPLALVAEAGEALAADGWSTRTAATPEGGQEVSVSVGFAGPDELRTLTTDLGEALAAPELRPLEPLTLTVTDEHLRIQGAAALQPREAVAELGLTPAQAEELLEDNVSYTLRIDLPGETIEATAARVTSEGVLVWDVDPGERETVHAVGVRPPPSWLLPIASGAVLVVVAAAAALALRRRRHRGAG